MCRRCGICRTASIRHRAFVSTTWDPIRFPPGVITPSVQLDVWASSPIYLSMAVLLLGWALLDSRTSQVLPPLGRRPALCRGQPSHRTTSGYGRAAPMMPILAQHLDPADILRFGELGVIASMQAIHGTSDGPWVPPRVGEERARHGACAWRALIDSGAVICNGTDVPVEPISPIASYYASVSRMMNTGGRSTVHRTPREGRWLNHAVCRTSGPRIRPERLVHGLLLLALR